MPHLVTDDGVRLYYEEVGSGTPVVFVHEFGGDYRSYEPQLRYFARLNRCVAFNARDFPPSDVPEASEQYSQERAALDVLCVLDGLAIERAHLVGVSMGAFAALHVGLRAPERVLSLVLGGCGYGPKTGQRDAFEAEVRASAARLKRDGMAAFAESYGVAATRVQYQVKDPRGWDEFKRMLAEHAASGSALTLLGVQQRRPSLQELADRLATLEVPTLVMTGDEDEACLEPSVFLKRTIPTAALVVMPKTGHALNLEEPARFNAETEAFFHLVEAGRWRCRDPRSLAAGPMGDARDRARASAP
jgi:pimeloyl-ACP methyl ester carboxylesterase